MADTFDFLGRRGKVGARGIDLGRPCEAALEEMVVDRPDPAADVEERRTRRDSGGFDRGQELARLGRGSAPAISVQLTADEAFVEELVVGAASATVHVSIYLERTFGPGALAPRRLRA